MSYEDTLIREMTDETPPNHEDACPVCDKIECVCPPETDALGYPNDWPKCPGCGRPSLDGHITCGLAGCDEGARRIDYARSQFGEPR